MFFIYYLSLHLFVVLDINRHSLIYIADINYRRSVNYEGSVRKFDASVHKFEGSFHKL